MNRIMKFGMSTLAAASVTAGALGIATAGGASATSRLPRATRPAACAVSVKGYALPRVATTYRAGAAGTVSVVAVNSGTLKVTGVHRTAGWRSFVDSSSGSSVDVYFRDGTHRLKFEAEINDAGRLTITVTSC